MELATLFPKSQAKSQITPTIEQLEKGAALPNDVSEGVDENTISISLTPDERKALATESNAYITAVGRITEAAKLSKLYASNNFKQGVNDIVTLLGNKRAEILTKYGIVPEELIKGVYYSGSYNSNGIDYDENLSSFVKAPISKLGRIREVANKLQLFIIPHDIVSFTNLEQASYSRYQTDAERAFKDGAESSGYVIYVVCGINGLSLTAYINKPELNNSLYVPEDGRSIIMGVNIQIPMINMILKSNNSEQKNVVQTVVNQLNTQLGSMGNQLSDIIKSKTREEWDKIKASFSEEERKEHTTNLQKSFSIIGGFYLAVPRKSDINNSNPIVRIGPNIKSDVNPALQILLGLVKPKKLKVVEKVEVPVKVEAKVSDTGTASTPTPNECYGFLTEIKANISKPTNELYGMIKKKGYKGTYNNLQSFVKAIKEKKI